ncbi:MAG: DUF99 family protein [Thaumarchaeota archaeon]|nr:DUF99 family protein [Candidatus Calditenuaceae archaeon]MDW8186616.1 DUF99 family protein [Nitrososphaerota archaeon]
MGGRMTSRLNAVRLRSFNPFKRAYRVFGVAESFRPGDARAVLGGVVMRADLQVDGMVLGSCTVGGMDSTESIRRMYDSLRRNDINLVMLGGCIISLFNLVDVRELSESLSLPVLCITFRPSVGLEELIATKFAADAETRLEVYRSLGEREEVKLKTGHVVYVRRQGVSKRATEVVLNSLTLSGKVPEPVRVARLLARASRDFSAGGASSQSL